MADSLRWRLNACQSRNGAPETIAPFLFSALRERATDVHIIEIKTGKVAATIPINLAEQSRIPSEPEFFATAWQCAIEDNSVDPARRDDYSFRLVR
jgi:hypothetical protein